MAKKILVVDDEPDIVTLLEARLVASGYEVMTAGDGIEALGKARHGDPDLIILDIMLPFIDGHQVCRLLKFDEKHRFIPIIILTARDRETDEQLAIDCGADAYIHKPFQADELMEKIRTLFETPRKPIFPVY